MQAFLCALQFLTRVPVKLRQPVADTTMAESLVFYPLVGLLIGIMLWLLTQLLAMPDQIMAIILLIVWVAVSGALHLDGLADSADAWIGGLDDRQRTLEIMKDSAAGPIAVIVLVLLMLLKFSALVFIVKTHSSEWLILAPVLGRSVVPILFLTTPYVREQGLGSLMAKHVDRRKQKLGLLLTVLLSLVLFPFEMLVLSMIMMLVVVFLLRHMMMLRLQGMTGDTIGATIELVEAAVLLTIVFYIVS